MNYGFARGINIAMVLAQNQQADYVLLLNNDIVVDRDFLSEMIAKQKRHLNLGLQVQPFTIMTAQQPLTLQEKT